MDYNRKTLKSELKLQQKYLVTQKVEVLKSTSKDIIDTWSVKDMPQPAAGGGTQVFSTDTEKFRTLD